MLFTALLPLLALSAALAAAKPTEKRSTRLNRQSHPRAPHAAGGMVKIRRAKHGKLGKKKRCQAPVKAPNNSTSAGSVGATVSSIAPMSQPAPSASVSASANSSVIGGNDLASPTVSLAPSASATIAPIVASSSAPATTPSAAVGTSDWQLVETVSGQNFFDAWNFWSYDDPTHGTVSYVDSTTAWIEGLVSINNAGHALMHVDTTPTVTGGRQSVRIHANRIWTGGMVLMDAVHMPTGCGTWPAWWMNGPNWPNGGEIDIIEGVNLNSDNQVSLHTGQGCSMPSNLDAGQTGQLNSIAGINTFDCASYDTGNQGCGVAALGQNTSYGEGFNSIGGGVYAMVWDKSGISVWYFPRGSIPADITNNVPAPSTWPTPMASFPPDNCDPYTFFYDNFNIFDTTLCGDWAGSDGAWNAAGPAGQSCAALTGYSTCSDYVLNVGSGFTEAYWEVSYVKYFNSTSQV